MDTDKVALITAGGSGMGADAARRLAADGFRVGVLSSSGKGEALGIELDGFGVTGSNLAAADLQRLVDGALQRWGRIDVLVNSAGHGPKGALLDLGDEAWHTGMEVYLMNVIRATRLVFPTSAVFRAGLAAFTKLYADQHAAEGIRMNNVLPGFIDSLPEKAERRAAIPMQRYGRAAEVASLVAWLASDEGAYMTGQNLRLDGGLTRSL